MSDTGRLIRESARIWTELERRGCPAVSRAYQDVGSPVVRGLIWAHLGVVAGERVLADGRTPQVGVHVEEVRQLLAGEIADPPLGTAQRAGGRCRLAADAEHRLVEVHHQQSRR